MCCNQNKSHHKIKSRANTQRAFLAHSKNELIQWRGVRRLSVCLSVCKLLRKSLLLAGKWPDRHQTFTRWTTCQHASRVCSRSRSRSKVTWYANFFGFLEWATPSLTVWFLRQSEDALSTESLQPGSEMKTPNQQTVRISLQRARQRLLASQHGRPRSTGCRRISGQARDAERIVVIYDRRSVAITN